MIGNLIYLFAQQPGETSFWTIVIAQAGVIVAGGKYILAELKSCKKERKKLRKDINKVIVEFAVQTGHTIKLDED